MIVKVAVGMFYHEANSFNPDKVKREDFVYCEGEEVIRRSFAAEVFREAGMEIVPLIYAVALPNGIVSREAYAFYSGRILDILKENRDVDGVCLHLHGSMEVDGVGSGEYDLVKRIRELLGDEKVIGVGLDIHANTDPRLAQMINVLRNYRTVPHVDQDVTEQTVARHMVKCLETGMRTHPEFLQLPYAIHPEKALGATWPLCEIFERLGALEQREEIAVASLGVGMVWCDCPTMKSNVAVTPSEEKYQDVAAEEARKLADYVYSLRDSFEYEQVPLFPQDARRFSLEYPETPVFVSDSGDNTTGGAVGDGTIMMREYLKARDYHGRKVLVTAIWDERAVEACWQKEEGEAVALRVGHDTNENNKAVEIAGVLKKKGALNGYMGCENDAVGKSVTISSGPVDVVLIDKPGSFISLAHFAAAGLDIDAYDVVVVKQGYLFPQLRPRAKLAILALTTGANYQLIEDLTFHRIIPPVYPLHYEG